MSRGRALVLSGAPASVAATIGSAIHRGDRWTYEHRSEAVRLLDMREPWRTQAPTETQAQVLRQREVPIPEGLTRGGRRGSSRWGSRR